MNKENNNSAYAVLDHWFNLKFNIIIQCAALGVLVGFMVVLYRYTLEFAAKIFDQYLYIHIKNPYYWPLILVVLLASAFLVSKMIERQPLISGSGIPQVKGYLLRHIKMPWKSTLLFKYLGGFLAVGSGLSLGREGPSIQIGALIGKGFADTFKRKKYKEKYLVTGGASAGLAAAFNAPLAGVLFALEELHKTFSPFIVITALATTVSAEFVSEHFFGVEPVLNFDFVAKLPLHYYHYLLFLSLILGLMGVIYNRFLIKSLNFFSKNQVLKKKYKIYVVFILAGLAVAFLPVITRGGHHLIEPIVDLHFGIKFLLVVFVFKFIFSMLSYGTGAPGGIFLPLLVLGAIVGSIYGQTLSLLFNMETMYIQNMIIFAMAGFLTSVVRAPITSSILICEMTGSFTHFLPVTIVVVISYLIPELLKCPPIYDSLLERILENPDIKYESDENVKVLLEKTIVMNSESDHKLLSEIPWPEHCLIVNIQRGDKNYIPKGDFLFKSSDIITCITDEKHANSVKMKLGELTEHEPE